MENKMEVSFTDAIGNYLQWGWFTRAGKLIIGSGRITFEPGVADTLFGNDKVEIRLSQIQEIRIDPSLFGVRNKIIIVAGNERWSFFSSNEVQFVSAVLASIEKNEGGLFSSTKLKITLGSGKKSLPFLVIISYPMLYFLFYLLKASGVFFDSPPLFFMPVLRNIAIHETLLLLILFSIVIAKMNISISIKIKAWFALFLGHLVIFPWFYWFFLPKMGKLSRENSELFLILSNRVGCRVSGLDI